MAYVGFTGASGGRTAKQTIGNFDLEEANAPVPATQVNLSGSDNQVGIFNDGTSYSSTGLDGLGNGLSANLLGSPVVWDGQSFAIGAAGSPDVVSATGQTIPLTPGLYAQLMFLATGVNGNQPDQTFTVNYTDGTTATFVQSVSDWFTPQGYAGESVAATMTYRDTNTGLDAPGPFHVYGYSLNIAGGKTVASITLPDDPDVNILAMDLVPASALSQVYVAAGAFWELGDSITVGSLTGSGTIDLNGDTLTIGDVDDLSSTFSGPIDNGSPAGGSLVKAGTGTLILSGGDTYTGTTTVIAGTLQVGDAGTDQNWFSSPTVNSGATAVFTDLAFSGSRLVNAGTATMTDSSISGESAYVNGGAIDNTGTLDLTGCAFTGNTSYDGAIFNGGTATMTDCTFSGNSGRKGGGLFNGGTANLTGCTFSGNHGYVGGALYNTGTATLTGCVSSGDFAYFGAFLFNRGMANLTDCTISRDSNQGLYNSGTANLTDCTISGISRAYDGAGLENHGTANLTDCTISGDTAERFGGGLANFGTATLIDCTISNNYSALGGGLSNAYQGTRMTLTDCTISGDSAGGGGGGVYSSSGLTITDTTLTGNSAYFAGGLGVQGGTATVTGSAFVDNSAGISGGGLETESGGTTNLTNCTFAGNTTEYGGGINNNGVTTLTDCTLYGNTGYEDGGGLRASSSDVTLTNTIVAGNMSYYGAPDITGSVTGTYNLIGTGGSGGLQDGVDGNRVGVADPLLGTLGDYGGPTETVPCSPAAPPSAMASPSAA